MGLESKLYKPIEDFVYQYFSCHFVKQQVGTKFGKIDVMGLRETSGDFEAGGEIKEETAPFLAAVGQTFAYSLYAHRCYLAVRKRYSNRFSSDEVDIASQFGIGLIEIGFATLQYPDATLGSSMIIGQGLLILWYTFL